MFNCCFRNPNKVVSSNMVKIEQTSIMDKEEFNEKDYNPIIIAKGSYSTAMKIKIGDISLTCKKFTIRKKHEAYRETKILKNIGYETYLPRLYKAIETPKYCYILYQFIKGRDLHQMLADDYNFPTKDMIPRIIKEITLGLHSLFKYNYIHLDIKFENIIIESTNPIKLKIIDLAFCEKVNNNNKISVCGTHGYIAPEILLYNRYFHNSDIWSLGIVMFGLFTRKSLFPLDKTYRKILENFNNINEYMKNNFEIRTETFDEDSLDLLDKMLNKNAAYRISIKGVLKHDFIKIKHMEI